MISLATWKLVRCINCYARGIHSWTMVPPGRSWGEHSPVSASGRSEPSPQRWCWTWWFSGQLWPFCSRQGKGVYGLWTAIKFYVIDACGFLTSTPNSEFITNILSEWSVHSVLACASKCIESGRRRIASVWRRYVRQVLPLPRSPVGVFGERWLRGLVVPEPGQRRGEQHSAQHEQQAYDSHDDNLTVLLKLRQHVQCS